MLPMQGPGFHLPGHGTRSHTRQLKILHATRKITDPVGHNKDPVQPNTFHNSFKKAMEVRKKWHNIFKSAKRTIIKNSILSKNIPQEWRWNEDILRWRNTKKTSSQQSYSKNHPWRKFFRQKVNNINSRTNTHTQKIRNEEKTAKVSLLT